MREKELEEGNKLVCEEYGHKRFKYIMEVSDGDVALDLFPVDDVVSACAFLFDPWWFTKYVC